MNTKQHSQSKEPISHCYWPADGWVIVNPNGEVVATVPPYLSASQDNIQVLVDALDDVANTRENLSPDLPPELRAYSAKTPLGWRIHNGQGHLLAHVPLDTPDAESKADLLVRAADTMWTVTDDIPSAPAKRKGKTKRK